jgi:adenylate cyclase
MFTDIVGYTALTQLNEAKALQLLNRHNELLRPIFPRFGGREIKTIGDSFLVEFGSALEATNCAVEIQKFLRQDNALHPPEEQVRIRVGIHLGDVVHSEADVLGDAVNVASRIEPLAEPEGVCVTGPVFEAVHNKVGYRFEKLEPKPLKNVRFPPAVYRTLFPWSAAEAPLVARSARNRIAVLPFANMSSNPDDAYFADGMTEELIAVLAEVPGLRVVSRTSVDPYKKREKALRDIGAELHVDSVLEGSVRRAGERLRITVQLIQTDTDEHLWAARYDRKLEDVFEIQTEIARTVAENLRSRLHAEVKPDVRPPSESSSESYLTYLKGRAVLSRRRTPAGIGGARAVFERALELDPGNARACVGLADAIMASTEYAPNVGADWLARSHQLIERALELDPNLPEAHASRATLLRREYRFSEAEREFRTALSANPSYPTAHHEYGILLGDTGRLEEAVREFLRAEEADPLSLVVQGHRMETLIGLGRLDEARAIIQRFGELGDRAGLYHEVRALYALWTRDPSAAQEDLLWLKQNAQEDLDTDLWISQYHALIGDREQAEADIAQLKGLPEGLVGREQFIGVIYGILGELDECFAWLERGLARKNLQLLRLRWNPLLARVRADPRFDDLMKRANAVPPPPGDVEAPPRVPT